MVHHHDWFLEGNSNQNGFELEATREHSPKLVQPGVESISSDVGLNFTHGNVLPHFYLSTTPSLFVTVTSRSFKTIRAYPNLDADRHQLIPNSSVEYSITHLLFKHNAQIDCEQLAQARWRHIFVGFVDLSVIIECVLLKNFDVDQ